MLESEFQVHGRVACQGILGAPGSCRYRTIPGVWLGENAHKADGRPAVGVCICQADLRRVDVTLLNLSDLELECRECGSGCICSALVGPASSFSCRSRDSQCQCLGSDFSVAVGECFGARHLVVCKVSHKFCLESLVQYLESILDTRQQKSEGRSGATAWNYTVNGLQKWSRVSIRRHTSQNIPQTQKRRVNST